MLGVIMGSFVLLVIDLEIKWLLSALLGIVFVIVVMTVHDRERFFWTLFVLSLQAYISFWFMNGHAGSSGLEFPLAFLTGVMLLGYYFTSGIFPVRKKFYLGGEFSTPIILIFISTVISLLFSAERFVGLVTLWTLIQYYVLYLIGLNCIHSKKHLNTILSLLIIVLVMQSLVYFIQAFLGVTFSLTGEIYESSVSVRAGGTVGANSAIYAAFVAPLMMLVIVRLMSNDSQMRRRVLWLVVAVIAAVAFVLTLRRGAWGGFALGFMVVLYLGYRRQMLSKGWLITSIILLTAMLVMAPVITTIVDSYRAGNPLSSAFDERMRLNQIAWVLIKAHPLVGTGPGSYSHVFKGYMPAELAQGWVYTVHNTYLLAAAEKGIPGLLAFCLFLFTAFKLSIKLLGVSDNNIKYFGLAMAGYIVSYAFIIYWEPMVSFSPNALLWFLFGLMSSAYKLSRSSKSSLR